MNGRAKDEGIDVAASPSPQRMPTELQIKMAHEIVAYLCQQGMRAGNHLTEQELVDAFQVSRSPLRGAMSYLAEKGILEQRRNRGFFVKLDNDELDLDSLELPQTSEETLLTSIVEDWFERRIPRSFSQAEFCRRYNLGRWTSSRVLLKLSEDGVISRNRGHGWRFELSPDAKATRHESYAFRLHVEPGAIRSPDFELDRDLARVTRRGHVAALDRNNGEPSPATLEDLDSAFHRLIGVSSRNQFTLAAIERQSSLRRALSYANWNRPRDLQSWAEHLEVLDALELGERERAAELMERHLANARDRYQA